jgi:hypothetical protein
VTLQLGKLFVVGNYKGVISKSMEANFKSRYEEVMDVKKSDAGKEFGIQKGDEFVVV